MRSSVEAVLLNQLIEGRADGLCSEEERESRVRPVEIGVREPLARLSKVSSLVEAESVIQLKT